MSTISKIYILIASSNKFVGSFSNQRITKRMIQGYSSQFIAQESIGFSDGLFCFDVEFLYYA